MSKLKNKVAIVTGASKGIGAAIAKQFAQEGASVVVNYASSKEGADKVVAEITGKGGKAIAIKADVAKIGEIDTLFAEATKAFGKLDILVNNAGGFYESKFRKQSEAPTPLGRIGQVEDIAHAAVFFASADSAWITGETLKIAGGFR